MKKFIAFAVLLTIATITNVNAHGDHTDEKDGHSHPLARAHFTSKVENREPVDTIVTFEASNETDAPSLVFFNEIKGYDGKSIKHTWMNADKEIFSKTFNITSPRYRLSTSVRPSHFKKWETATVIVSDGENGDELGRFLIQAIQ